tara:strand:- start:215 stop:685 length:471 start_codon:yes stop_codon:yes gene_type:complete
MLKRKVSAFVAIHARMTAQVTSPATSGHSKIDYRHRLNAQDIRIHLLKVAFLHSIKVFQIQRQRLPLPQQILAVTALEVTDLGGAAIPALVATATTALVALCMTAREELCMTDQAARAITAQGVIATAVRVETCKNALGNASHSIRRCAGFGYFIT